ncbi:MAG: alpha-galactosidase [Paenibacillus sp.]|nr:alpha-galactosidase [Paenibacillus sp.]
MKLKDWLDSWMPWSLRGTLEIDILSINGLVYTMAWDEIVNFEFNETKAKLEFKNEKLKIETSLEAYPNHGAIVIKSKLTGTSDKPLPLNTLMPVRMVWKTEAAVAVRTCNGGTSEKEYPPIAYTERIVSTFPYDIQSGSDGRSSNKDLPIMQVAAGQSGVVASMEWSGLWKQTFAKDVNVSGTHVHELEIIVKELALDQNEELQLPPVHLVFYEGGLDNGGNAFRKYVYDKICPSLHHKRPLPPISYDHWFGVGNSIDETFLKKQADRCSELGLDYFVVDAGWFAGGFPRGLGNWNRVDTEKFPNGLEPLAKYVKDKGMKFGLWFEVERAHKNSDIYLEHPEWFLSLPFSTNEYLNDYAHIDLSLKPAQEWVIDRIGTWIERLELRWSRLDYNISPMPYWQHADPTGKKMFRYYEGLYHVLDVLMDKYPEWLIEGCASGGRRLDLAAIRHAHTYWFSDHASNPHICRYMQSGASRFLPGHLLNSAVMVPFIGAGDSGLKDVDVISRMLGALSFNGDVASWSPEWTRRCKQLVNAYRDWRWLVLEDFYALVPQPRSSEQPEVVQFASRDGHDSLIFGFVAEGSTRVSVLPQALREDMLYVISNPFSSGTETELCGNKLMQAGLEFTVSADEAYIRRLVGKPLIELE